MTVTIAQRDKVRAALLARSTGVPKRESRQLRRAADESRVFDRFFEREYKRIARANPGASPEEIIKKLIEFITSGNLERLIKALVAIFAIFV
jgi:hypothetical protein